MPYLEAPTASFTPRMGRRLPRREARLRQAEMAQAYVLGLTIREIAQIFEVGTGTVWYALHKTDTPRRPLGAWRKLSPQLVEEIYAEFDGGCHNQTTIAETFGVSQSYVSRLLRQRWWRQSE